MNRSFTSAVRTVNKALSLFAHACQAWIQKEVVDEESDEKQAYLETMLRLDLHNTQTAPNITYFEFDQFYDA